MRRPAALPLRIAALAAGLSIIPLRDLIDSRAGSLTLLLYISPYVILVLLGGKWRASTVGFAVGFSTSMQIGLIATLVFSLGFPNPIPPGVYYTAFRYLNLVLTLVATVSWVRDRKRISSFTAASMALLGVAYPFLAFLTEVMIGGATYH
ncbi:MAG: hypothetical protein WA434_08200 [Candidatus Acidiferrales bacterium]